MTTASLGSISLPGCKSFTNRALLCAAASPGVSRLRGISLSDDSLRMGSLLEKCGVGIHRQGDSLEIAGLGSGPKLRGETIDVADTGTALRFLLPFIASGHGRSLWTGTERMKQRPIVPLLRALQGLGARFHFQDKDGALPFELEASGIEGGGVEVDADQSSQFLSGLLLAAPLSQRPLSLRRSGSQILSGPYLAMTASVQKQFGVEAQWDGSKYTLHGEYRPSEFLVPGDASAAFWFLGTVALTGGSIRIGNLGDDPISATLAGLDLGVDLGFATRREGQELVVRQMEGRPFARDFSQIPDLVPVAAVLALFLEGESTILGIPHLRWKESDRLAGLGEELSRCGARIHVQQAGLRIEGGVPLRPARLSSRGDHRLAAAFSLLRLRVPGVEVDDLHCISKSYPSFFQDFRGLFRDNPPR